MKIAKFRIVLALFILAIVAWSWPDLSPLGTPGTGYYVVTTGGETEAGLYWSMTPDQLEKCNDTARRMSVNPVVRPTCEARQGRFFGLMTSPIN